MGVFYNNAERRIRKLEKRLRPRSATRRAPFPEWMMKFWEKDGIVFDQHGHVDTQRSYLTNAGWCHSTDEDVSTPERPDG